MTAPTILSAPALNTKYKPNAAKKRGEARRIDAIVAMDKRHKQALAAGDKAALLVIAADYAMMGMPNTASQVTFEAMNL